MLQESPCGLSLFTTAHAVAAVSHPFLQVQAKTRALRKPKAEAILLWERQQRTCTSPRTRSPRTENQGQRTSDLNASFRLACLDGDCGFGEGDLELVTRSATGPLLAHSRIVFAPPTPLHPLPVLRTARSTKCEASAAPGPSAKSPAGRSSREEGGRWGGGGGREEREVHGLEDPEAPPPDNMESPRQPTTAVVLRSSRRNARNPRGSSVLTSLQLPLGLGLLKLCNVHLVRLAFRTQSHATSPMTLSRINSNEEGQERT